MPYIFQFGKYSGQSIEVIPADYLEWRIKDSEEWIERCKQELQRRKDVEEADQAWVERIAQEGYRSLAKKTHPDAGGNETAFRAVQAAYEQLKIILKEVKAL